MNFARPWLLLLLLLPLAWWWWRRSRPAPGTSYSDLRLVSQVGGTSMLARMPLALQVSFGYYMGSTPNSSCASAPSRTSSSRCSAD